MHFVTPHCRDVIPAVVVVTVDVQHLLALDTEHAAGQSVSFQAYQVVYTNPERMHSVRPAHC